MIQKDAFDGYNLICDMCGEEADMIFEGFMDAVAWKRERGNGWRSVKDANGDWQDLCTSCNCSEVVRKLMGEGP
jgi:hypothetical protein